jgi:hypothetical protein
MAFIVWSDVTAIAPELVSTAPALQIFALAEANSIVRVDAYDGENGITTKIARIMRAAHRATLMGHADAAGPIIAETEGALSTQYAAPFHPAGDDGDDLRETAYGRQYLGLVRRSNARAWVLL